MKIDSTCFLLQVAQGMCKAAVKAPEENRYCNLFPFDESRVVLSGLKRDYINASWVSMPGVRNKFILTMAPMHPDSKEEYTNLILSPLTPPNFSKL